MNRMLSSEKSQKIAGLIKKDCGVSEIHLPEAAHLLSDFSFSALIPSNKFFHACLLAFLFIGNILIMLIFSIMQHFIFLTIAIALALFFLFAVKNPRFKIFLHDWSIYLALLLLFNSFRGLDFAIVSYWHLQLHAHYVIALEKFITFGAIAPHWMQSLLPQDHLINLFTESFAFFYGAHFGLFLVFGLLIWFTRPTEFRQYKMAFLLLILLGISCYLLFPTVPPWMASDQHLIPQVLPLTAQIYSLQLPVIFQLFDSDPIAAMPSLHAAFSTMCALIGLRIYKSSGLILVAYALIVYVTCLILGAHYLVDLLLGSLLAIIVFYIVYYTQWLKKNSFMHTSDFYTLNSYNTLALSLIIVNISFLIALLSSYLLIDN